MQPYFSLAEKWHIKERRPVVTVEQWIMIKYSAGDATSPQPIM